MAIKKNRDDLSRDAYERELRDPLESFDVDLPQQAGSHRPARQPPADLPAE